jgi:dUTP pyrophosphatase
MPFSQLKRGSCIKLEAEKMKLKVQKIHPDAIVPKYAHKGDSGMDLYSVEERIIPSLARTLIPTGIRIAVPLGYEAQVRPRSGLALKKGITVLNSPGTIDSGYRGDVGVILVNHSRYPVKIDKGERIAQMIIQKVEQATVEEVNTLDETDRGAKGFGSTGRK